MGEFTMLAIVCGVLGVGLLLGFKLDRTYPNDDSMTPHTFAVGMIANGVLLLATCGIIYGVLWIWATS